MATLDTLLLAFNRGVVSKRGLARIDIDRLGMSAETQTNWVPRVLGSMMFRPGLEFIDRINDDANSFGRQIPFTFGVDDTAALELSPGIMRIRIDDVLVTCPTVSSSITNGTFDADIASWTDASDAGGAVGWQAGSPASGLAILIGDGTDFGIMQQAVTVATDDQSVEHCVSVEITDGPVRFKVGTAAGLDDYVTETRLDRGFFKFAFTPTGNFTVEIANERASNVRVSEVSIAAGGVMTVATPWALSTDLPKLRWDQSGDIIYVASDGIRQAKIERRGSGRSWGVAQYLPENGPFRVQNTSGVTLTASALNGNINLTASQSIFKAAHVTDRSLFRISSSGQTVTKSISGADDFTSSIRVVGKETARVFGVIIEGTFVATVTLQFSIGEEGNWNDIAPNHTVPTSENYDDGQDDQVIYYRLGVKAAEYTSGTITATLTYTGGSIVGVARAYELTSATVVKAHVLSAFGAITASKDWWEGEWSLHRNYPTAVALGEGRLWWAGRDKIFGSVSDGFEDFDDETVGDSGPISRSIGSGPIRVIHWLISMGRLLFGTSDNSANIAGGKLDGNSPLSARSNSFDEPLTPTNFNIKSIDSRGVFVDRTKQRLYELSFSGERQDYEPIDLSVFAPDFNAVGITQIAVQMKPDIRIHCVRSDGTVGMLVYDRLENVICWISITSPGATGLIEDVSVLPGVVEDQVYYIVKRTINSGTQRHLCKWALESEAIGGDLNKIADSFAVYDGSATTTPFSTELLHLRDESVVVWADGIDVGEHTVSAYGGIILATAASKVVAGKGYTGQFKSAKLGRINGIGLLARKFVTRLGFIAENLHYQGVQYGPDFDNLYDIPGVYKGSEVATDTVHADYHDDNFEFGGEWNADSRICLEATAPKPATILAVIAEVQSVDRSTGNRSTRRR